MSPEVRGTSSEAAEGVCSFAKIYRPLRPVGTSPKLRGGVVEY